MAFKPGFNIIEAKTLLAISDHLNKANSSLPIPDHWAIDFDSPELGPFNNKYQLWKNTTIAGQYALVIRGTVKEIGSQLENLVSVLIPASGSLPVGSLKFSYKLANDPNAAVHLGFTLGLSLLLFDGSDGILSQLISRADQIQDLFITGHSQGAAIATLCRSYFQHSTIEPILKLNFKTYLFAQPKPGNDHYAYDFEHTDGISEMAFRITNTLDWVPQVMLTFELLRDVNSPNPIDELLAGNDALSNIMETMDRFVSHQVEQELIRLGPMLEAVGETLKQQTLHPTESVKDDEQIRIIRSLYFTCAGQSVVLIGEPSPDDTANTQHSGKTYYKLLSEQFPDSHNNVENTSTFEGSFHLLERIKRFLRL